MANWEAESSRHINRRLVITGTLILDTPATFSSGETNGTELVILEDALERRPLLPGASLTGALRHYLLTRELGYNVSKSKTTTRSALLFGEALDNKNTAHRESHVIVSDALGSGNLTRREGVKINGRTRTADEGMLFSTQVWEAGTTFDLCFELVLYEDDPNDLIAAFAATLQALGRGEIALGGRKQRGYGRLHIENWHVCYYDLSNPVALSAWLQNEMLFDDTEAFFNRAEGFDDRRSYVRIEAALQLCESLLIRAASNVAENEHLSSRETPVLSGTSLAGALRARTLKIANTVNPVYAASLVNDLFGQHGAKGESEILTASRIRVEEHPIVGGKFDLLQNRIKIDRFTGGTFETALFDERPLFADGSTFVQVNLELRYPDDQAQHVRLDAQMGLLLLALKDLWTEDLPLGGESSIGRGRLRGQTATVSFKFADENTPTTIYLDEKGLRPAQADDPPELLAAYRQHLETYVQALLDYREKRA